MPALVLALIVLLNVPGPADDFAGPLPYIPAGGPGEYGQSGQSGPKEIQVSERVSDSLPQLDRRWRVFEVEGAALPDIAEISFEINGDKVTGQSTCNRFETTLTRDGNKVAFGKLPRMRKSCGAQLTRIEAAFFRAYRRVDRVETHPDGTVDFHGGPVLLLRAAPFD